MAIEEKLTTTCVPTEHQLELAVVLLYGLPLANGLYNPLLVDTPVLFWMLDAFQFVAMPCAVIVWLGRHCGLRPENVGLHSPFAGGRFSKFLVHSVAASAAFFIVHKYVLHWSSVLFPTEKFPPAFSYRWMEPESGVGRILAALYNGFTAGFVEEFYFRGLLILLLRQYGMGISMITLVSASMFALVHWEGSPSRIIVAFVIGIGTAAYSVKQRQLWPLILAHLITDAIYFYRNS